MTNRSRTYVLVHGAWHGSWVWDQTRSALRELGYASVVVDLPSCGSDPSVLGTLADDAVAISGAIDRVDGPVTVVAHSYAGMAVAEAQLPEDVSIVFLAAWVPDPGRSLVDYSTEAPVFAEYRAESDVVVFALGMARDLLYHDLSEDEALLATARLVPQNAGAATTPVSGASWHTHVASYVVCTEDRVVPLGLQRTFATRTVEVRELRSSHSPMLSQPAELARLLVELP